MILRLSACYFLCAYRTQLCFKFIWTFHVDRNCLSFFTITLSYQFPSFFSVISFRINRTCLDPQLKSQSLNTHAHVTSGPMHTIPQSLDSRGKCQKGWDSICPHSLEESGAFCHLGYRISMDVTTNPLPELSGTALPRSVSIWSRISQLDVIPSVSKSTWKKSHEDRMNKGENLCLFLLYLHLCC